MVLIYWAIFIIAPAAFVGVYFAWYWGLIVFVLSVFFGEWGIKVISRFCKVNLGKQSATLNESRWSK